MSIQEPNSGNDMEEIISDANGKVIKEPLYGLVTLLSGIGVAETSYLTFLKLSNTAPGICKASGGTPVVHFVVNGTHSAPELQKVNLHELVEVEMRTCTDLRGQWFAQEQSGVGLFAQVMKWEWRVFEQDVRMCFPANGRRLRVYPCLSWASSRMVPCWCSLDRAGLLV